MSEDLSPEEKAEYERQLKEENHPKYHSFAKCGMPLTTQVIHKVKITGNTQKGYYVRNKYCPVHKTYLGLTGWELHWYAGEYNLKD